MQANKSSCHCQGSHKVKKPTRFLPVLTGVLIALIPKCPFCVMAYSTAITLCSGATLYDHQPAWTSYVSVGLAALTLLLVLWNYKGFRTWIAALFILIGSYFILDSELYTGELTNYYWGSFSLLAGVWMNGSFFYFYNKYIGSLTGIRLSNRLPEMPGNDRMQESTTTLPDVSWSGDQPFTKLKTENPTSGL